MIVFELTTREDDPIYRSLEYQNSDRQLGFLQSMVTVALETNRPLLSQTLIKALNFHAIACLHAYAGEYRPCEVIVGNHSPPEFYRVPALMDDFVNLVNRHWESEDPFYLAAYVLWRLNYIHPFINGNGRTARACCYFVICVKAGGWIEGPAILPKLLRQNRDEYVEALRAADRNLNQGATHKELLEPLRNLIARLLDEQTSSGQSR